MAAAPTGRNGDGYQGRGASPREGQAAQWSGQQVPRQRPPQDRREPRYDDGRDAQQWDQYAEPARPTAPRPRGAAQPGPASLHDPRLNASFGARPVDETHIPRGTRRKAPTDEQYGTGANPRPGGRGRDGEGYGANGSSYGDRPARPAADRSNRSRANDFGARPAAAAAGAPPRPGSGRRRRDPDESIRDSFGERPAEMGGLEDWDEYGSFTDRPSYGDRPGDRPGGRPGGRSRTDRTDRTDRTGRADRDSRGDRDDTGGYGDDEVAGGRTGRPESRRKARKRRKLEAMTPEQRRRRKIIKRSVLGAFLVMVLWLTQSIGRALLADGNMSTEAKLAEWGRSHGMGGLVTWAENEMYNMHPPQTGGTLSQQDLQALAPPTSTASLAKDEKVLPPLKPFLSDPVPGEGTWEPQVVVNGVPLIQVAKLRSDPIHTSYLSAVAWIDQKHASFVLHPGSLQPGGSGWNQTNYVTDAQKKDLVATWNGAFLLNPNDAHGGFYLNGKTYNKLVDGQAAEVFMKDGSIGVGQWGRDYKMTPDVVGVRENLVMLVDNGQINPSVTSSDINIWGKTVANANYVWRSGVGITADGNVVYAMGPTLNVQTLAQLLQRAGAVRAMELDINADWVSFMTYDGSKDPANPAVTKLLDFKHTGQRYFSKEDRDFVAVYARPPQ